jgi:two-component system, chemotaxis family, sensor kinase CheA
MNGLHEQFVAEARDLIHQATDDLIAVERESASVDRIDRIFRAFHTLKGSAGVVELPAMVLMLHAGEDVMAAIHSGTLAVTSEIIDQALACLDQVSRWVDSFEAEGTIPLEAGTRGQIAAQTLRELLPKSTAAETAIRERFVEADTEALPGWVARLVQEQRETISPPIETRPESLLAVSYEPRPGCFFDGDDPLALMRAIPDLLAFQVAARDAWPPLGGLDPYACNLRFEAISAGGRSELERIFRLVPDQVRIIPVPFETVAPEQTVGSDGEALDLVRNLIEEQRRVLTASDQREDMAGRAGGVARAAANALRHIRRDPLATPIEQALKTAISRADVSPLHGALDAALAALASATFAADAPDGDAAQAVEPATDAAGPTASRVLRVGEDRIEALLNLAGELIVAKNNFAHLARRIEKEMGEQDFARAVRRENDAIERLAGEMYAAILQLRLVPVAQAFRAFPRLVRDIAHRLGKKVALVTHGETTEADKTVVDRLFEPLLHLLRNALDHGIEGPETRHAAGKPGEATVTLRASRLGDRFVVEVSDDGCGIDPDVVRRRAAGGQFLAADELAALSDAQALNLIFAPGFSTAAKVSDISGRGVGMDVVRTMVEQLGGQVSVNSGVGTGTTVRLELPMNIALTRIMAVEIGGQVFGIPLDAVTETVRLSPDRIGQIKGNEGVVLRDRIVPICRLAEMMNVPTAPASEATHRLLVVIEAGGKVVAIEVDAIRDRFEAVLKPMQGLLSNARGYAGTTLLADGTILLVLDIKELLP